MTTTSGDFHDSFQSGKREILSLFDLETPSSADIAPKVQALRSTYSTNLAFLPAYDRKNYDQQLKELEIKLTDLRAKDKPKSRFAFSASKAKPISKPLKATSIASSSTPPALSTTQATPIHLISDKGNAIIRAPSNFEGGYTISLTSLSSCIIDLRQSTSQATSQATSLHAKELSRCILIGPIMEGSAIMEGLEDCLVVIGAQQFRIHSSRYTTILLHVPSTPIIEHSSSLVFGPYPDFLHPPAEGNRYDQVQDFDWVREGHSPNWSVINEADDGQKGRSGRIRQEDLDEIRKLREGDQTILEDILARLLPETRIEQGLQPDAS